MSEFSCLTNKVIAGDTIRNTKLGQRGTATSGVKKNGTIGVTTGGAFGARRREQWDAKDCEVEVGGF